MTPLATPASRAVHRLLTCLILSAALLVTGTRGARAGEAASCGDANASQNLTATDALFALRSAVGSSTCEPCICDANGSGSTTATDALVILKAAVGTQVDLLCPPCNLPPVVDAGEPQSEQIDLHTGAAVVTLSGSAGDDGKPVPPGTLTTTWTLVDGPSANSSVLFDDASALSTDVTFAEPGQFVLRLTADDGDEAAFDDVTITITESPLVAPVLVETPDRAIALGDAMALRIVADDENVGDELTYSVVEGPDGAGMSPAGSGLLVWTPVDADELGVHEVTVRVEDSAGLSDTDTFSITVTDANHAPVLAPQDAASVSAGSTFMRLLAGTDADGDALTFELIDGPDGMTLDDPDDATLTWTPDASQLGSHIVKVRVSDSGNPSLSDVAAFFVTVTSNAAPLAVGDAYEVEAGQTLVVGAAGVLANDVDPDGDELAAALLDIPALGEVTSFSADGAFTFQAPAEAPGQDFAIDELWRGGGYTQSPYAFPLVGDVNEDGYPDVVMSVHNASHLAVSGLDGSVLWYNVGQNPQTMLDVSDCAFWLAGSDTRVLADIDEDGELEYVVPTPCSRDGGNGATIDRVVAFNSQGQPDWISPRLSKPHPDARPSGGGPPVDPPLHPGVAFAGLNPSVARLEPEAPPVLLMRQLLSPFSAPYTNPSGQVAYAGCRGLTGLAEHETTGCRATILMSGEDGTILDVLVAPNAGNLSENYNRYPWRTGAPFAADLDGDGQVEIVSGSDVWRRIDGEWTLAWQTELEPAEVAVADLDGDGDAEVIHLSNRDGTEDVPAQFMGYILYDKDGVELRRLPLASIYFPGWMTVADVDGDSTPDLVQSAQGLVTAMRPDGLLLWAYVIPEYPGVAMPISQRSGISNVQVYDLDGDGVAEIVVGGTDGVHVLDGRTGVLEAFYAQPAGGNFADIKASFVIDADDDGHTDILYVARRDHPYCGDSGPDCNTVAAVRGAQDDWMPGPKSFHHIQYRDGDIDDDGNVLYHPGVTRTFRTPEQRGEPRDPREAHGTSFTYQASDGAMSSQATVFVEITPANRPPVFTSTPPSSVLTLAPYDQQPIYTATAVDPDAGDVVHYELVVNGHPFGPGAASIDSQTGALTFYTGPCGSFGGPCEFKNVVMVIAAVDQLGARTEQAFFFHVEKETVTAPDVVSMTLTEAQTSLEGVLLKGKLLQQSYDAAPAGTVIAQDVAPGTTLPRYATVFLTVSKGPAPVVVPNVVGLLEDSAAGVLEAAAFDVTVEREYSAQAELGRVLSQTPAAGEELPPGAATITVSLGTGLSVRLDRDYATADQPITVQVFGIDTDGNEAPFAGADLAVEATGTPHLGAMPAIDGYTIVPGIDTRGVFRVTATDTIAGRSGSAEFVVTQAPGGEDESHIDAAAFAEFAEVTTGVLELMRDAEAAGLGGDEEEMADLVREAVELWRSFDQTVLRLSSPFAIENGLPPQEEDMAGFGVTRTAEDELNLEILENMVEKLTALIEELREEDTPVAIVDQAFAAFEAAAAPLQASEPSEYGYVQAQPEYAVLAAHLMPDWMDALMNDMARATGIDAGEGASAGRPRSTLGEELTVLAVTTVVDELNVFAKVRKEVLSQAFAGVMLVGVAQHLRVALQGQELVEVVAGASLSFRQFYAPYSMIEGFGFETKYPQLNEVIMLGPDTAGPGVELFNAIKDRKFDTLFSSLRTLTDGYNRINDFLGAGNDGWVNGLQRTHFADAPCIFTTAPGCAQLIFPGGFYSIYTYSPPDGMEGLVGLPVPIIVIVRSQLTGEFQFATPPFIPYKPGS